MNLNPAAGGLQSRQLVEHLWGLTLEKLGPDVIRDARIRVLDALGCGFYGARMPWGRITTAFALAEAARGPATIFNRRESLSAARAALCNGTAMHGIELDDIETRGQLHPGSIVIPAALAAAEHCGASGERLLLGVITGYEALSRIGRAIHEPALSFHMTGIAGPPGAAIAAGIVMGLDCEQILRAAGIACSCAAGIKSFTQGSGGMIKRMHAGRAAESGVMACLLVERGFTAPLAAIDGRFGLLDAFGGEKSLPHELTDALGREYIISRIWTKVFPCCGFLHAAAQGLEQLRREHHVQPGNVEKVRVAIQERAVVMNGAVEPRETMAAQYSMPFVAAVALAGDVRDPRSFEGAALENPVVRELARRVELYSSPEIEALLPHFSASVEVQLKNGSRLHGVLKDAHGTVDDPCSESQVQDKFRRLTATSLDKESIEAIVDIVSRLDRLPSVASLSSALRGKPTNA